MDCWSYTALQSQLSIGPPSVDYVNVHEYYALAEETTRLLKLAFSQRVTQRLGSWLRWPFHINVGMADDGADAFLVLSKGVSPEWAKQMALVVSAVVHETIVTLVDHESYHERILTPSALTHCIARRIQCFVEDVLIPLRMLNFICIYVRMPVPEQIRPGINAHQLVHLSWSQVHQGRLAVMLAINERLGARSWLHALDVSLLQAILDHAYRDRSLQV